MLHPTLPLSLDHDRTPIRCTIVRWCAVGTLALLVSATSSSAGVTVVNGGAETGTTAGWVATPPGSPIEAAMAVRQSSGVVVPYDGEWFFSFSGGPESGTIALLQVGTIDSATSVLRLTGRCQTEFGDAAEVVLRTLDDRQSPLAERSTGIIDDADLEWREFSVAVPIEPGAVSWQIELRGTLVAGQFINVFYDAVMLTESCPADIDGNAVVDGADLGVLLGSWGDCATDGCVGDLTGDGVVDGGDLGLLLSAWGPC